MANCWRWPSLATEVFGPSRNREYCGNGTSAAGGNSPGTRLGVPATLWAFSPGARLAAAGSDELSLWDVATGESFATWPSPSWLTAVAFPTAGTLLATGHDDASVRLWDTSHGEVARVFLGHSGSVSALAFSPDGKRMASAGEDREVHVWDVATGELLGTLFGHTDRIPALAWHPSGTRLISAGWDTTARVWNLATYEPEILLNSHAAQVQAVAFTPDGSRLACARFGLHDPSLGLWS